MVGAGDKVVYAGAGVPGAGASSVGGGYVATTVGVAVDGGAGGGGSVVTGNGAAGIDGSVGGMVGCGDGGCVVSADSGSGARVVGIGANTVGVTGGRGVVVWLTKSTVYSGGGVVVTSAVVGNGAGTVVGAPS